MPRATHTQVELARPLACWLVIPAYNEATRIRRCLDSVLDSPLPEACYWSEWTVVDAASPDGTADKAQAWSTEHSHIPMRVARETTRRGKATSLASLHAELVARHALDDVVVVVDADSQVTREAISDLVSPFCSDKDLGIVWGIDEPDNVGVGRWAPAFQMKACNALAEREPSGVRAYGAFFAYRVGQLATFTWVAGEVTDDMQVARYVAERSIPARTAKGARVRRTPAGSYHDFYLQTFRFFAAQAPQTGEKRRPLPRSLRAAAGVAIGHPHWAVAYFCARALCTVRHRLRPATFTALWEPPVSTKGRSQ